MDGAASRDTQRAPAAPRRGPRWLRAGLAGALLCAVGCAADGVPPLPAPSGTQVLDADRVAPGYALYSGRWTEQAYLIDLDGEVVHSWSFPQGETWCYAELLDDGRLAVIVKESEGQSPGMFFELSWDGELLRRVDMPVHHDFVRRPDGDTVLLCREYPVDDAIHPGGLKSDFLAEIGPGDELQWAWHAHEHAFELTDHVALEFPRDDRDWAHTNTIEVLPANPSGDVDPRFAEGNLLFSMCNVDTIGVLDGDTRALLWAWGPGIVEAQHMPTMLPSGNLLIYDNGDQREWTRVIELDPITEQIVWSFPPDAAATDGGEPPRRFYSRIRGSAQRLANGNTFIADSDHGRLFEVTADGDIVWDWTTWETVDGAEVMPIYRGIKYPPEMIEPLLSSVAPAGPAPQVPADEHPDQQQRRQQTQARR